MSVLSVGRGGHAHLFLRHLAEMVVAMTAGMIASAAVFLSISGLTVDEALRQYPVLFVIVQASGMTAPMILWMRHRRHEWRECSEMAAAMVVPAVALICLRLSGAVSGPICGLYCAISLTAMVIVMLFHRPEYTSIHPSGQPS